MIVPWYVMKPEKQIIRTSFKIGKQIPSTWLITVDAHTASAGAIKTKSDYIGSMVLLTN